MTVSNSWFPRLEDPVLVLALQELVVLVSEEQPDGTGLRLRAECVDHEVVLNVQDLYGYIK